MPDKPKCPSRQQLGKFLPDQETIRAIELLFKYVVETAPETTIDLSSLIYSIQNPKGALEEHRLRLERLEVLVQRQNSSIAEIIRRLNELESFSNKRDRRN